VSRVHGFAPPLDGLAVYRDAAFYPRLESVFSADHRYRYWLRECFAGRVAEPPYRPLVFLMCNPSSAGRVDGASLTSDPTVRRCSGFARDNGYTDRIVVNACALVSTDPEALKRDFDPVGPLNEEVLAGIPRDWDVLCAWGAHPAVQARQARVLELLGPRRLLCLRTTKNGAPGHPLYAPANLKLVPWEAR
jgi:hypothetical protein